VRVLLVDLVETRVMLPLLDDLELLVEVRLDFSSLMTLEDNDELLEVEEAFEEISELKDEGIDTDVIPWFQNNEN